MALDSDVKTVGDLIDIVKRRKWYLILPALGIFLLSIVVVLALPSIYQSTSTILIEEQSIPREYVTSTVSEYAEQRLQTINQTIMSTTRLTEIIKRFNLYADLREKETLDSVIERMRKKDIKFETISADVIDRRTGRPTAATIAFSLSYKGKNPGVVQQVANMLASLYLEENLRVRGQQAEGATKFMEEERKAVEAQMAAIDKQIAAFKQKNVDTLPELSQYNLQNLDRLEQDLIRQNDTLKELKEKETYLQSQLASIPLDTSDPNKERLKELRVKLVNLENRFTDEYPDVKKTKAEIADLEKKLRSNRNSVNNMPDNPAYVTLSAQLASTRSEIASVRRQISSLNKKQNDYQHRITHTPRVEEDYKMLMTQRNNLQAKYDDLTKKYMESKVASGLEKGQMGERFTLMDAANFPEKPVSPNVPAILLIGLILGIGAGVGSASFKEFTDQSVYSAEVLSAAISIPVLAVIPEIYTAGEIKKKKMLNRYIAIGIGLAAVCAVVIVHFFFMDLDVLWTKIMRKIA